jgi:hypothetical protein
MTTTLPSPFIRGPLALLLLVVLSLASGCAAYQLGAPAELPFKTVYIRPASNHSYAPQAQAIVSSQLREHFIRDGRLKLVTSAKAADAVLTVNLTDYKRRGGARRSTDTVVASDFVTSLSADISLYNSYKGDYFFENRRISDHTRTYIENPYATGLSTQAYQQSEYQAMPVLARELARKIADEVLSVW